MLASPACPLLLAATLALSTAVSALPLAPPSSPERRGYSPATPPAQFIDYFPTFTSPSAGDVFQAGGDILISWNATKPNYPDNQLHTYALVVLGYLDSADPGGGYHLDFDHPLGNVSFYSGSGSASLPLPANLTTRSTYLVTMGSTQNISPLFTIEGSADAPSSTATTSAAESATATTSASASASSATAAQIESIAPQPLTVHFPDGSTTVVGGSAAAAAATSTAGAGASIDTSLNDIAAPKTSSEASETSAFATETATESAAATSGSASQSQVQATPSLAQAGAASSPSTSSSPTSGAGSIFLSSRHSLLGLGLATVAAFAVAL
ncbi:hypothetical protein JCM8202_001854 [Rhodotorula sphaerocarpa]